ncbi:hypothetical protein D9758_007599 [Tetrapyrgos nigripes]|uniref:Enoyl reductase (ER) domain-containing protein n=1 Tax=Tetrapyrgos nigripes TaxID=182062 RepID=A0A8H5G7W1_9AGAR|nr:hypothetical protein D9758_007599 [Tetrapyrgos nigripes]
MVRITELTRIELESKGIEPLRFNRKRTNGYIRGFNLSGVIRGLICIRNRGCRGKAPGNRDPGVSDTPRPEYNELSYSPKRKRTLKVTTTSERISKLTSNHHLSMTPNPRVIYAKSPGDGAPIPGEHLVSDTSRTIDLDSVPLNGGFLTKTLVLSPEPYMRDRMRDPSIPSYCPTFVLGEPIIGPGVVVVVRSEKEGVNVGDYMYGQTTWEAYCVQPYIEGRVRWDPKNWAPYTVNLDDAVPLRVVPNPNGAFPLTTYCNLLGTPGLTAFVGFEALAEAKAGETIFVSSGASGVGSVVIQLAKLKGLKVITSVGSEAKISYVRSIGADIAFNYKTRDYSLALNEHGPIDIYWDNVGGPALEAAIDATNRLGRIICCGSVADYNVAPEKRYGIKNTTYIFRKSLIIRGLLLADVDPSYTGRFFAEVPALVAQGKIVGQEFVTDGIENAPQAFVNMLKDGNDAVGKPVIAVAQS